MCKKFHVGQCLVCQQGILEIVKEEASGKIFVSCDECEAEWGNPEDALKNINGSRGKYGIISGVTLNEIQNMYWDNYIR